VASKPEMNLKELLTIAVAHLKDLTDVPTPDFRLEQAAFKEKNGVWDIVVSYLVPNINKRTNPLGYSPEFPFYRIYKRLLINEKKEIVGLFIFNDKE
jgi:hypothetical protein